jgi:hypothetical protein
MDQSKPQNQLVAPSEHLVHRLSLVSYNPVMTASFYEMLGFKVNTRNSDFSLISAPGLELRFFRRDAPGITESADMNSEKESVYIYVPVLKIDEYYTELRNMQAPITVEMQKWPWGRKEFNLIDLDGYYLVFYKPSVDEKSTEEVFGKMQTSS